MFSYIEQVSVSKARMHIRKWYSCVPISVQSRFKEIKKPADNFNVFFLLRLNLITIKCFPNTQMHYKALLIFIPADDSCSESAFPSSIFSLIFTYYNSDIESTLVQNLFLSL